MSHERFDEAKASLSSNPGFKDTESFMLDHSAKLNQRLAGQPAKVASRVFEAKAALATEATLKAEGATFHIDDDGAYVLFARARSSPRTCR